MRASIVLIVALLIPAMLTGCAPSANGPADTYGLDFSLPPGSRKNGVILFFVDGVNADIFQQMLDSGQLPAFKKYFVDRGTYVTHAVANIPSVTIPNLTSVATGRFPGDHDVVGVNWFDRNRLVWRNYNTIAQKNTLDQDYTAPTVYEALGDELTFSLFFQPHRGATKFFENWTSAGPPFFFGWYEFVDRLTLFRFNQAADIARAYRRFPAMTVAYLLATDFTAYHHGVQSEQYRDALKHTDYQIGRVLGDLDRAGLLGSVTIMLVSDHGMGHVTRHMDMAAYWNDELGIRLEKRHWWESDPFEERLEDLSEAVGVSYGSGDRYWAACLRKPIYKDGKLAGYDNWLVRPDVQDLEHYPSRHGSVNLLETLVKQPSVDVIAYRRGPQCVRVRCGEGEVEFSQPAGQGGDISYRVVSGSDPLGYAARLPADVAAGKAARTPRQWLDLTADTEFPDLPAQILAYFRSERRAGDIAIFATQGWDFRGLNRAGHGGVRPVDMFVPVLMAGPGVPHKRIAHARTVDLMPTILTLWGRPLPPAIDGMPLVEKAVFKGRNN